MIDKKKLLDILEQIKKSKQKQVKTAERNPEGAMLEFALRNQLAMLYNVIGKIKEQPKIGEWTPCSERLPKEEGRYIVCLCYTCTCELTFKNGRWFNPYTGNKYTDVTAWQPLPEPYRVSRDNSNHGICETVYSKGSRKGSVYQ